MKTIKSILITAIILTTVSLNAQDRRNTGSRNNKSVATQQRKDNNSSRNKQERTITVNSRPSKTYDKVNRSNVNYKKADPKVVAVRSRGQSGMKTVSHNSKNYYYNSGVFYRKYNNNFVKVAPPTGLRISILPEGHIRVAINSRNYFYFEGTFYRESGNEYIVETPPVGAIVYALPADYEKVNVDGAILYEFNGILYERVSYNGKRAYQVVGYLD